MNNEMTLEFFWSIITDPMFFKYWVLPTCLILFFLFQCFKAAPPKYPTDDEARKDAE